MNPSNPPSTDLEWCKTCNRPYRIGEHTHTPEDRVISSIRDEVNKPDNIREYLSSQQKDQNPFSGVSLKDIVESIEKYQGSVYSIAVRCYNCNERQVLVIPKGQPVSGKCNNCGCTTLSKV